MKALLFATLIACTAAEAQQITRLDHSHISSDDAAAFAQKTLAENHVTGAQLAVLNHGKLVWSYAYGLAGKSPDRPFNEQTTTWAASLTKSVFATYVMLLVERGQFDLDLPVAQQVSRPLTTWPRYDALATELIRDPLWPLVTPRMLLAHTSGLANAYFAEPDKKLHLHFKPGARYSYSTEGINLLGAVLEQKFGKPLDTQMTEALFMPLGMSRTGLIFHDDFAPNVADRFDLNEKFLAQTRRSDARAGGSMSTSADDLARFLAALFANKILTAKARQQMFTPQIAIPFAHQFQFGPNLLAEGTEGRAVGLSYGLGWGLLTRTRFGPAFFKEGHGDGAQNYLICFERSQSCMVLLTNSDNGELAFRPLLEHILGDTVTPWEWEGYTPSFIADSRNNQ